MKSKILQSGFGIFGSAFFWLASFKVVAIWLGPSGVGLFSQFRQIVQVAASLGGINSIVQGLSERDGELSRAQFRNSALKLSLLLALLIAFFLFFFAQEFAMFLFGYKTLDIIHSLRWIALASLFSVLNVYIVAVLNGYKAFFRMSLVQISGPFVLASCLIAFYLGDYQPTTDLLAIFFIVSFFIMFMLGAYFLFQLPSNIVNYLSNVLPRNELNSFLKFAASTILAALSGTFAMLLIKAWIIKYYGLDRAGLFDSAWSLSFNYITLFLTACSSVYLPLLTESKKNNSQAKSISKAAYLILGSVIFITYFISVFKIQLLTFFYSNKFEASGNLLSILLLAILVRSVSWTYGLIMVSSKKSRAILLSEVCFNGISLILIWIAIHTFKSDESLAWAILIANLLYCIFILIYVKKIEESISVKYIFSILIFALIPLALRAINWERDWVDFKISSISSEFFLAVYGLGLLYIFFKKYTTEHYSSNN